MGSIVDVAILICLFLLLLLLLLLRLHHWRHNRKSHYFGMRQPSMPSWLSQQPELLLICQLLLPHTSQRLSRVRTPPAAAMAVSAYVCF